MLLVLLLLLSEPLPEDGDEPLPALGWRAAELLVDELLPALLVDALAAELLVLGLFFSSSFLLLFVLIVDGELSCCAFFVAKMSSESCGKVSILRDAINVSIFPFLPLAGGVRLLSGVLRTLPVMSLDIGCGDACSTSMIFVAMFWKEDKAASKITWRKNCLCASFIA